MGIIKNFEAAGPTSATSLSCLRQSLRCLSPPAEERFITPLPRRGQIDKRSQRETFGSQGWVPCLDTIAMLLAPPLTRRCSACGSRFVAVSSAGGEVSITSIKRCFRCKKEMRKSEPESLNRYIATSYKSLNQLTVSGLSILASSTIYPLSDLTIFEISDFRFAIRRLSPPCGVLLRRRERSLGWIYVVYSALIRTYS